MSVYLILYGGILIWSDGLPFVSDNNESFSSLWHSFSMYQFGFGLNAGLTDEVFSPQLAAHPYVHTHQGNFPRLFGFLLYAVGLRTIEAHIVVTALSIGVVVIFFLYHFLYQVAGTRFAVVTALVFLTDYILFAQWHLVTYRVWHGFFLFASLLCAMGVVRSGRPLRWLLLTGLTYIGLYYYELIFVAFVSLFSAFFVLATGWRQPWRVVGFGMAQVAGGSIGLGVLILQLAAYLGWDGLREDLYGTYLARNYGAEAVQGRTEAFYTSYNIAFWRNVLDAAPYRTPLAFVDNLFSYQLQPMTPLLVAILLTLLAGWLVGLLSLPKAPARWSRRASLPGWISDGVAALQPTPGWTSGRGLIGVRVGRFQLRAYADLRLELRDLLTSAGWWMIRVVPLSLAAHQVLVNSTRDRAFLGLPQVPPASITSSVSVLLLAVSVMAVTAGLIVFRASSPAGARRELGLGRVAVATLLLWAIGAFVPLHPARYDAINMTPLWWGQIEALIPMLINRGAFFAAVAVSAALALCGSRQLLGGRGADLAAVAGVLACGFLAAVVVYIIATGYVISGYVWRWAPLYVFVVDIAVGAVGTVVLTLAIRSFSVLGLGGWRERISLRSLQELSKRPAEELWGRLTGWLQSYGVARLLTRLMTAAVALVAAFLLVFLGAYWLQVQRTYVAFLPPTHFRLLKELTRPPYLGATMVVNTYAAPVAYQTQQWAYFDPAISSGGFKETPTGYIIERDMDSYMWLADRAVNPDYQRPAYYVCMIPQDLQTVLARLIRAEAVYNTRCSDRGLIRQIEQGDSGATVPLRHQLVARDTVADSWAIVKLDWDYAPILAPYPDDSRITVRLDDAQGQLSVTATYQFVQQDGKPEGDSILRVYRASDESSAPELAAEGSARTPILLREWRAGRYRVSVTPATATRTGPTYFSAEVAVQSSGGGR